MPIPQVVVDALTDAGSTTVGKIVCPPVTIRHLVALSAIHSPFVAGSVPAADGLLYECARALTVLALPPDALPGILRLARNAPDIFEARVFAVSDELAFADIPSVADRILEHLDRPFALALKGGDPEDPSPRAATESPLAAR